MFININIPQKTVEFISVVFLMIKILFLFIIYFILDDLN